MALEFSTTDRESQSHGVKILVYGDAGAGKTMLCGSAPSPLIISAEAGLLTLRHQSIPVIKVTDMDSVDEAYDWCKGNAAKQGIQTICLDSISEIVEKCLEAEKAKTKDPRQAYGEMAVRAISLVKRFRDLPGFHVVITAKQATQTDTATGVSRMAPTAPGQQVGSQLPYLFDEVFRAFTDKDQTTGKAFWALQTQATFNAVAKDRSGVLEAVEFPDLNYLITKMLAPPAQPTTE